MEMMQYKPWEKKEVESLINQSNKSLPILDIQFGGCGGNAKQLLRTYINISKKH